MAEIYGPTRSSLTNTLILALTQSQEQVRLLEDQRTAITRLQRENDRLREEIEHRKQNISKNEAHNDVAIQIDDLFQGNVEKQAEIDLLKKQLKKAQQKERYWRERHPYLSSPALSSDGIGPEDGRFTGRSANRGSVASPKFTGPRANALHVASSPARKRLRSSSPNHEAVLSTISGNVVKSKVPEMPVKHEKVLGQSKKSDSRGADAIDSLAEDGIDYSLENNKENRAADTKVSISAAHRRLGALLDQPSPAHSVLSKPQANNLLNKQVDTAEEAPAIRPGGGECGTLQPLVAEPRPRTPKLLPNKRLDIMGPEDAEPLRARPLARLGINDFKVNKDANAGLDYAFNEVVRSREQRKCMPGCTKQECCGAKFRALAQTLPLSENELSDYDLLRQFLGPDSDEKIRTLTSLARSNLLEEARIKNVADVYGKQHRSAFERPPSPPGYWNADMPGTQEREENNEEARRRERQEVGRRYQEAMKENGLWKFCDERD